MVRMRFSLSNRNKYKVSFIFMLKLNVVPTNIRENWYIHFTELINIIMFLSINSEALLCKNMLEFSDHEDKNLCSEWRQENHALPSSPFRMFWPGRPNHYRLPRVAPLSCLENSLDQAQLHQSKTRKKVFQDTFMERISLLSYYFLK